MFHPKMLPNMGALALLIISLSIFMSTLVSSSPPGPVVTCTSGNTNCTVINSYGAFPDRSTCKVASVAYPSNETQLLEIVSNASRKKQKMKAVTVYSHSIPKLSCPGGRSGEGLVISTMRMNRTVSADVRTGRMTVESGIKLRSLIDAAARVGLAVPHSPYWEGMTLGGLISTGSHGSSLFGKGSAVHEYVVGMRVMVPTSEPVNGYYARVLDLGEDDPDLLAAKVSLGVLGVISQITLQLEPMFKRNITNRVVKDVGFEEKIISFGAATQHGDITWYPSMREVVYRDDFRVPVTTPGMGVNDFTGFRSQVSLLIAATRSLEVALEASSNAGGKCVQSKLQANILQETGAGLKNNDGSLLEFTGYPVIGNQSAMMSSGSCLNGNDDLLFTACGWDPRIRGLFNHQTTVSIPLVNVSDFIKDVKKLRDMFPDALCGAELNGGFLMRYIRKSTAYLGKTEDSVDIDIIYYRSRDPNKPRLYEDVQEEVEQIALFKYKGLPHWGKNRNVGFFGVRPKLGSKADKFVEAMRRFDPQGLFSSEWTDGIFGLNGADLAIVKKGCALEGLCLCSIDDHCAPEDDYFCRPGFVYPQARVCRKANDC